MGQGAKFAALATLIAALAAGPASAGTQVLGGGLAEACYRAAKAGARGERLKSPPPSMAFRMDARTTCNRALAEEPLMRRDLAATLVNRGVVLMGLSLFDAAQADFDRAVRLKPDLAEAHVNRGGALVARRRYSEGIEALTTGLSLAPEEAEKAYFNRGLAYEAVDNIKAAYLDFLKAAELSPAWAAPKAELTRFKVVQR